MSETAEFPALRANGYRDTWCGQILSDRVGSRARVAGWVHRRRDHGGLIFIDLRDRTGLVQLVFNPDTPGDAQELGHRLRAEDVLSVAGEVVERDPETVNAELPTGEYELRVAEAELLADAETPPFEIEGYSGEVGEELRLRYRYLDLRRERMRDALVLRDRVTREIRRFLEGEGFLDIETPVLTRSTPEGARDFLVPSRQQHGSFYALPQSPQLFKQMLMFGGLERYYQIARCFRDEDLRADRQLDFTQLDIEMSFVEADDVIDVNERLLAAVLAEHGIDVELPFKRIPYDEAISRYGSDKPDTAVRHGASRSDRGAPRDRVQRLPRRDRGRGSGQGHERRHPRDVPRPARRPRRRGEGAGSEGPGVGGRRGRRLALAGREVPRRRRDRGDQRGPRGLRGRRAAARGRRRSRSRPACSAGCASAWASASA